MFNEISELLDIVPNKFIVSTQNTTNGTFINHYILSKYLCNPSNRIILILFDKTITHYKSIHAKLGEKLDIHIKNGNLVVIDASEICDDLDIIRSKIFETIRGKLLPLNNRGNSQELDMSNLIMIDDISTALFSGNSLINIHFLIQYLRTLVNGNTTLSIFNSLIESDIKCYVSI